MSNVETQPERLLVIRILAILDFIAGLACFYYLAITFYFRVIVKVHQYPPINYGNIIFYMLFGLISFIIGWGLWSHKRWGYWGEILLLVANLLYTLFTFAAATNIISTVIQLVVCIIIIFYLLVNKRVRKVFHPFS